MGNAGESQCGGHDQRSRDSRINERGAHDAGDSLRRAARPIMCNEFHCGGAKAKIEQPIVFDERKRDRPEPIAGRAEFQDQIGGKNEADKKVDARSEPVPEHVADEAAAAITAITPCAHRWRGSAGPAELVSGHWPDRPDSTPHRTGREPATRTSLVQWYSR